MSLSKNKWTVEGPKGLLDEFSSTSLELEGFQVTVHRWSSIENTWFLSTYGAIRIDRHELKSKNVEDAKWETLSHVKNVLGKAFTSIKEAFDKEPFTL